MADVALTGGPTTRLTRSHALLAAGAGVATLLALRLPSVATPGTTESQYHRTAWAASTGSQVHLEAIDGRTFPATVVAVSDLAGQPPGDPGAFSLLFRAESGQHHAGTVLVRHPRMGEVPMIALPVGRPGSRQLYEAVVNTSRGPGGHHG